MKTELHTGRITRTDELGLLQSRHQGLAEARNSVIVALTYLVVAFTAALVLSAALTRCWRRSRSGQWPGLSFVLNALSLSWQGLSAHGLARREG
jgi:hypothetical protein